MKIEIDQSGKIADTKVPTVLAFSNGKSYSLLITAVVKRRLIHELRQSHDARVFYFRLFAILVFILIKDFLPQIRSIYIDREYQGREGDIEGYLIDICVKHGISLDEKSIHFVQVGKKSRAHIEAITAFRSKKADRRIMFEEAMRLFLPTKKDRGPHR